LAEQPQLPKYSKCPIGCKIGHLKSDVIDEIDTELAQGYEYQSIIDTFPQAALNPANISVHKNKHLDMAKALIDLGKAGIKTEVGLETPAQEMSKVELQSPELAKRIRELEDSGIKPVKSIDIMTQRINSIFEIIKEMNNLDPKPHRICVLYDQTLQRWIELYMRLTGEQFKQENAQEMSQAMSWVVKKKQSEPA